MLVQNRSREAQRKRLISPNIKKSLLTALDADEAPLGVHRVAVKLHEAGEDSGYPLTVQHRTVPEYLVVNVGDRDVMLLSL